MNNLFERFLKKLCINNIGVAEAISKASRSETYVETISNKADALHWNINRNYPETITQEFFRFVKPEIIKQRLGLVDLVADLTEEDFYGKHSGLWIHGWTGEKGVRGKLRYLVVAISVRNQIIPFYVEILPIGAFKAESLGKAVNYCKSLGLKIGSLLLDRGFYSGDVIDTLQLNKTKYLIFVPKNNFIKKAFNETKDDCIILHDIMYTKDKRKHFAISDHVLIHNYKDYAWAFATNIDLKELTNYVSLYKKRWNIETMFRVHDEARIKSKSVKPEVRLFYFVISMLLLLIWNIYYKTKLTFKLFTIQVHEELEQAVKMLAN